MKLTLKGAAILAIAAVTIPTTTFFVGANSGADSLRNKQTQPAIVAVEPGPLKQQVIEREVIRVKTEKVFTHPLDCLEANQLAVEILEETDKMSKHTGKLQTVADNLARAIVLENVQELNKAKALIRTYKSEILASQIDISNMRTSLASANDSCNEQLGEQAL
jgi:hypothetical protein